MVCICIQIHAYTYIGMHAYTYVHIHINRRTDESQHARPHYPHTCPHSFFIHVLSLFSYTCSFITCKSCSFAHFAYIILRHPYIHVYINPRASHADHTLLVLGLDAQVRAHIHKQIHTKSILSCFDHPYLQHLRLRHPCDIRAPGTGK